MKEREETMVRENTCERKSTPNPKVVGPKRD